jgi:hypothetical protein
MLFYSERRYSQRLGLNRTLAGPVSGETDSWPPQHVAATLFDTVAIRDTIAIWREPPSRPGAPLIAKRRCWRTHETSRLAADERAQVRASICGDAYRAAG